MPELFAFAGLCFLLNESYDIYGGNVMSTMAGEFSFSIAISFMMLGLGFLCRGLDEGRYRSGPRSCSRWPACATASC